MTVAPTTSEPPVDCRPCALCGRCTCRIHFVTSLQTLYPMKPHTGQSVRMLEFWKMLPGTMHEVLGYPG